MIPKTSNTCPYCKKVIKNSGYKIKIKVSEVKQYEAGGRLVETCKLILVCDACYEDLRLKETRNDWTPEVPIKQF